MEVNLMLAITRLFRSVVELNESTEFCAFARFSGHVNTFEIEIGKGKERKDYSNKIYTTTFRLKNETWSKSATVAEVQGVINLIDYLIEEGSHADNESGLGRT